MKRSITYRENYVREMEKYRDFDNYDKLKAKFDELQNPLDFYEFMSKNELTKDLTYQSDQVFGQMEFNSFLQDLGILDSEDLDINDSVDNFNNEVNRKKYRLVTKSGRIIAESDNRQELVNIARNSKDEEIRNALIYMNY